MLWTIFVILLILWLLGFTLPRLAAWRSGFFMPLLRSAPCGSPIVIQPVSTFSLRGSEDVIEQARKSSQLSTTRVSALNAR
jgi:hypothetical protein